LKRLLFLLSATAAALLAQSGPVNLDFREGPAGGEPVGWVHQSADEARVLDEG
jgi:hypothetical protein